MIDSQPGDDRGKPSFGRVDGHAFLARAVVAKEGFLHHVLPFRDRTQHAVGDGEEQRPVRCDVAGQSAGTGGIRHLLSL